MTTLSPHDLARAERSWRTGADRALAPHDLREELAFWLRERALLMVGGEPLAEAGIAYATVRIRELTALAEREARARGLGGYQPAPVRDDLLPRFSAAKFVDLVDLAETLTGQPARRIGDRAVMRCPFHDDGSPSLTMYPPPRGWYCFGCRAGGDAVAFVSRLRGTTAVEALLLIEEIADVPAGWLS